MVYIHINQKIRSVLADKKLKFNNAVVLQGQEYIQYKDLKKVVKKTKSQLHKYIHRYDIVSEVQIINRLQANKLSEVQKIVIQRIKNKQKYQPRSLINRISLYSGDLLHSHNIPLVQDLKKGLFLTFLFCATSLSGYLLTSSIEGEQQKFSAFGPILGGLVTFLYALRSNKRDEEKVKKPTFQSLRKIKKESASITFNQNMSYSQSLKSKGKIKKS